MVGHLSLCGLLAATLLAHVHAHPHPSQGSSSGESAENSGEVKDGEDKSKAGGVQRQFWMPTYKGTNPLGRKKIEVTTSEMERYYTSEEMPVSAPIRNRTRRVKDQMEGEESMPLLWSGDQLPANKSQQLDFSMDSDKISLDSESSRKNDISGNKTSSSSLSDSGSGDYSKEISVKAKRNKRPTRPPKIKKSQQKKPLNKSKKDVTSFPRKDTISKSRKDAENDIKVSNKKEYVEKELTSQFFNELSKAASNESTLTTDYYKRLVKAATDNTKQKLGYRKIPKTTIKPQKPTPEFIFVNIDSKSINKEKSNQEEEIIFSTHHDQHGADLQERPKVSKKRKIEIQRVNKLAREFTGKLRHKKLGTNESATIHSEDSFTSACDYSAWSDVLLRNRTFRTFKQRKPKMPMRKGSFERSEEGFEKWPGKDLKDKADKLRAKKGKREKKKSKDKKTKSKKNKYYGNDDNNDYDEDYDYQDDKKPEKKIRMRTKGEKNHAVREVKDYLKKMDDKYGGRPGEGRRKDRGYERDREQDKGREKGRNFGYNRKPWDEEDNRGRGDRGRQGGRDDEWKDRNDRGRGGRWDERGDRGMGRSDRRGGRWDERGDRGRSDGRGRRQDDRGGRWDRRRDDRRGDRGGRWDRGRDNRRESRGGRWDRGRDDRRNVRGGDRGRGGSRGRGWGRGRGRG